MLSLWAFLFYDISKMVQVLTVILSRNWCLSQCRSLQMDDVNTHFSFLFADSNQQCYTNYICIYSIFILSVGSISFVSKIVHNLKTASFSCCMQWSHLNGREIDKSKSEIYWLSGMLLSRQILREDMKWLYVCSFNRILKFLGTSKDQTLNGVSSTGTVCTWP